MRLGVLINLAPRKRGSLEDWLVEVCREARRRRHRVDVHCRAPVHPEVAAGLRAQHAGLFTLDELEARPAFAVGLLSRYDVLELNLVAPRSTIALLSYAAWPARVLYVAHSDYPPDPGAGPLRRLSRRGLDRVSLLRATGLAGVSSYIRDKERARFGLPRWRVRTIHNGVDVERFHPRPPPDHPGLTLFGAGYLIRNKGYHHLLAALSRLGRQDLRLRLAGDGPELSSLSRLAQELGLSGRVELLGLRDDLPELLSGADLFVHPTLFDAFGLAVAEAMACGLPVIASRVGGVPELVLDEETGLLVAPGDVAGLARAIERLAADPGLRSQLGRAGAHRIRASFDLRECACRHLDWCEESDKSSA
ncbi:MAG: glycosyltransferase family 4 protein [Myxococcaceae bacterium]